ncbi:MAG TPA: 50S ribosomal protein L30 [Bacteroidales bacterium]|nr:50S ribosomal protein L30 [Bacteroidales bacterium]
MARIKITQTGSKIHCTKRQKLNLQALGLRKLNSSVEHEATPQILGMVEKVRHLLKVTEL